MRNNGVSEADKKFAQAFQSLQGLGQSPKVLVGEADLLRSNNFSFGSFLCALAQKEKNSDSNCRCTVGYGICPYKLCKTLGDGVPKIFILN